MNNELFEQQLSYILHWWAFFVDWENGGIISVLKKMRKEKASDKRIALMHLRQMYNYSVGYEFGVSGSEKIARHLYETLYQVFPNRSGNMITGQIWSRKKEPLISGYLNAYQAICLSRFARAFNDRQAAELSLKVYQELDLLLSDGILSEGGTWDFYFYESKLCEGKSDDCTIHRCEAALNVYRALEAASPDLLETHKPYLQSQLRELTTFFDRFISRPEEGMTIERLQDDCNPPKDSRHRLQSLAHGFEWFGFCQEIEAYCRISIPFMDDRMRILVDKTMKNGLSPNGCFRNRYCLNTRSAPLIAEFWPQVEAVLGALWARKRWGEKSFPLEHAEQLMNFYQKHFFKPESLGGGIMSAVSENGCPIDYGSGHGYKCDHHAVRLVEKTLEFNLLAEIPE